jgi:hypothetical protein
MPETLSRRENEAQEKQVKPQEGSPLANKLQHHPGIFITFCHNQS